MRLYLLSFLLLACAEPEASWRCITLDGALVGRVERRESSGQVQEITTLQVGAEGASHSVVMTVEAALAGEQLKAVTFELNAPGAHQAAHLAGEALKGAQAVEATLGARLWGSPGEVAVFDPTTRRVEVAKLRVAGTVWVPGLGRVLKGFVTQDGQARVWWVSERGAPLYQELSLGLTAAVCPAPQARRALEAANLGERAHLPLPGLPRDLEGLRTLRLELSGCSFSGLALDGGRQRLEGAVVTLSLTPAVGLPFPAQGPVDALEALPTVQIHAPELKAAAQEALGDAQDTATAAARLTAFVHRRLRRRVSLGVPDALETFRRGEGDCNEHAALFAALARGAGIPTRIAVGLAYREGALSPHAWNEVAVAGSWLAVDPTWGQAPADVGHLRLAWSGGQGRLASVLGSLKVRRVEPLPGPFNLLR